MSLNGSPGLMQQTSSGGRSQPQQIRGSGTLTDHQRPQAANPFFFPERFLDSGLRLDGAVVQKFPVSDDPVTHLHNIMALPMREDDVVIAAYHKSGESVSARCTWLSIIKLRFGTKLGSRPS